jgi:serine/threonine protein kinase
MVVMKYVHGETIDKRDQLGRVLESVRKTVHEAVKFLHQKKFVHGDIRCPNIIIEDSNGEEDKHVKLVDFDWSRRVGEVRYPLHLLKDITWPKGVEDFMYQIMACRWSTDCNSILLPVLHLLSDLTAVLHNL